MYVWNLAWVRVLTYANAFVQSWVRNCAMFWFATLVVITNGSNTSYVRVRVCARRCEKRWGRDDVYGPRGNQHFREIATPDWYDFTKNVRKIAPIRRGYFSERLFPTWFMVQFRLPKRRFWKDEQKMKPAFSIDFSRVCSQIEYSHLWKGPRFTPSKSSFVGAIML